MRRLIGLFSLLLLVPLGAPQAALVVQSGGGSADAGPVIVTPALNGGTIAAGGTSQTLVAANPVRVGMTVQNPPTAAEQGLGQCTGASIAVPGITYTPGDTVTLAGGTKSVACVLTVTTTQVSSAFSPTVVGGGTTCTNNTAAVLTGTTGVTSPGGFFQLIGVISGNALTSITSIYFAGNYTTNPTVLTAEPVTVTGCTIAPTVSIKMGGSLASVLTAGKYSNPLPTNPLSESATSGSGTGNTWTTSFGGAPENLYVGLGRTATVNNANYCNLAPGDTCPMDYDGHVFQGAITVIGATTGHAYNATEFTK